MSAEYFLKNRKYFQYLFGESKYNSTNSDTEFKRLGNSCCGLQTAKLTLKYRNIYNNKNKVFLAIFRTQLSFSYFLHGTCYRLLNL